MIKMISEILGSRVILYQERAQIAPVSGVIIDPADGAFLGIKIKEAKKQIKVIPSVEIKGFGPDLVMIKSINSLSEIEDVVRIERVLDQKIKIIGNKVETEGGQVLGRVYDATIDLNLLCLERLFVNSIPLISFLSKDLIIPAKKIIEIKKDKIIVSDEFLKSKSRKVAPLIVPVPD